MIKTWSREGWVEVESCHWFDGAGYKSDKDGYCSCFTCQYQKEKHKKKIISPLPEELFEL